ncbi:MAG: hypothetical protein WD381_06505 [Balneolaceae bacterium]
MQWLKNIVVDLLTTIVIALAVFYEETTLTYIVYAYTILMCIARLASLLSRNFQKITQRKVSEAPIWVYHLLYFLNVLILGLGMWFITAAGWIFIWGVAAYVHKRQSTL